MSAVRACPAKTWLSKFQLYFISLESVSSNVGLLPVLKTFNLPYGFKLNAFDKIPDNYVVTSADSWGTEGNPNKILGINKAARCTTIKPAGTTSLTLGTSSGIHAWHNDFYIRRLKQHWCGFTTYTDHWYSMSVCIS